MPCRSWVCTTSRSPSTVNGRPVSTATRTNSSTCTLSGTSDARGPPQRSLGAQPCSATRRTAASQAVVAPVSSVCGRRGSTTATTSSGTNSDTRSSHIASTSGGAAVSTVRGVSRPARENTVDRAFGTAPSPVSTTSDRSTGRLGTERASSATSADSRETGHTSWPTSPP